MDHKNELHITENDFQTFDFKILDDIPIHTKTDKWVLASAMQKLVNPHFRVHPLSYNPAVAVA